MFGSIAGRYDCANDVLSLGMHRLWRRTAVRLAGLTPGMTVLDLCTGTGDLAEEISRVVGPDGQVFGLDFVFPMLIRASRKYSRSTSQSLSFLQGDAMRIPLPARCVDAVTIAFGIRNVDDPRTSLAEIRRVLRPQGTLMVLEFGQPGFPMFSSMFRWYSKHVMPALGSVLTGNRAAYEYLPQTSRNFAAGEEFVALMRDAGFVVNIARPFLSGVAWCYVGKSAAMPHERANEVLQTHASA